MDNHTETAVEDVPESNDPLANIPELTTSLTTDPDECTAALKLVADSVAQMKQTAGRSLLFNPFNIAIWVAALGVLYKYMYKDSSDIGLTFTTAAGITMAFLVSVRWFAGPYVEAAEKVGLNIFRGSEVLVTKYGSEVIGCAIYAFVPLPGEAKGNSGGRKRKGYRCEIRGWAVRIRYRGKGVGTALLEDCVKEAKAKGCEAIEFAEDHPSEYTYKQLAVCTSTDHCFRLDKDSLADVQWRIRQAGEKGETGSTNGMGDSTQGQKKVIG